MTQKELKIIKSIEFMGTENHFWGIHNVVKSTRKMYNSVKDMVIPYTHFYVYREETFNKNPRLNEFQNLSFPDPDLTLKTSDDQIIDFYYISEEEGGAE